MTSTYPIAVDELAEKVQDHATELGRVPRRNEVMRRFKVGGPKATKALSALRASGFDPSTSVAVGDQNGQPRGQVNAPVGPGTSKVTRKTATASSTAAGPVSGSVVSRWRERWPLYLIAAAAFVSIWGGWVGLGEMTGFGPIRLLPGINDAVVLNTAITLPLGVEAYATYALRAFLNPDPATPAAGRRFAGWSAMTALALGIAGQVAYHLMEAAGITTAPWQITAFVSCLPVVVLGCAAALAHLTHQPGPASSR